ncbi:MAG: hypothetical protein MZU91_12925 [Desulfosudis oleivorans]|nr:hypothetical protein [Desulfosudis oleivorans]
MRCGLNTPPPALIRWFCDELFGQLHQGLLRECATQRRGAGRDSRTVAASTSTLRDDDEGRRDKLHREFDELTADNRYNQALKAALRVVHPLTLDSERLQRDVGLLIAWLADVADVRVTAESVRRLPGGRLVARYARALRLAEWFLASTAPDVRTGRLRRAGAAVRHERPIPGVPWPPRCGAAPPEGLHLREEGPRHHLTRDPGEPAPLPDEAGPVRTRWRTGRRDRRRGVEAARRARTCRRALGHPTGRRLSAARLRVSLWL